MKTIKYAIAQLLHRDYINELLFKRGNSAKKLNCAILIEYSSKFTILVVFDMFYITIGGAHNNYKIY